MEIQTKTGKQKKKRNLILAGIGVLLLGLSVLVTCLPGGWKAVYHAVGLVDFAEQGEGAPFTLHVLNVGKADALLIRCGGDAMLVDCGMVDDGAQIAADLRKSGVTHLSYAVGTHCDNDHIGGFPEFLDQISADVYYLPPLTEEQQNNAALQSVQKTLVQRHIPQKQLIAGDVIFLQDAQIQVLSPREAAGTENDSSLVLKITYGKTSFLLMGDASAAVEQALLDQGVDVTADVLKVGHHGSNSATTTAFLEAVSPSYAAISVGEDSSHLPKDAVLRRLELAGVQVYRTDLDGSILFCSDGTTVTVQTEQGGTSS